MVAVEDPVEAGEYERRLKQRPSPFVTQLNLDEKDTGTVRVGVNIPSLLHRALSCLPSDKRPENPVLSWRINTNFTPLASHNLPAFKILSNKLDREHEQPPSFKVKLRLEQLRSLEWMIKQEARDAQPFVEEEISEAMLTPLGWRAEGRAQRPVRIRGGVLADQVGYGKTAITLGLIDCTSKTVDKEFAKMGRVPGKISVKGTLVIVPPHLTRQWNSEVKKFTGQRFKVLVLSTVSNLNSTTIEDIQEADIIVVASNIFKSNVYLENLQLLAGVGELPTKDGRHFNAHLDECLESLKTQTDLLQDQGSTAVITHLKEAEKRSTSRLISHIVLSFIVFLVQGKRLLQPPPPWRNRSGSRADRIVQLSKKLKEKQKQVLGSSQQLLRIQRRQPIVMLGPKESNNLLLNHHLRVSFQKFLSLFVMVTSLFKDGRGLAPPLLQSKIHLPAIPIPMRPAS